MAKKKRTVTEQTTAPVEKTVEVLSEEYRAKALDAKKMIETNYLYLAEAIFKIKHEEWYRDYGGAQTFVDYVKHELDMDVNKAFQLTKIWDAIISLNLPKDRLLEMGWTKAAIVAQHAKEDTADELIAQAERMSTTELRDHFT